MYVRSFRYKEEKSTEKRIIFDHQRVAEVRDKSIYLYIVTTILPTHRFSQVKFVAVSRKRNAIAVS